MNIIQCLWYGKHENTNDKNLAIILSIFRVLLTNLYTMICIKVRIGSKFITPH